MSLVSFVKVVQSDYSKPKQAISQSLNLINYTFPRYIKNVVIKANMCYYWDYSTGQTTDPKFVAALIDVIRREIKPDTEISIVEADASAMKCKYAFKLLGYEKLANDYNVHLVNLSKDKSEMMKIEAGNQLFHLQVPQTIQDADLKINVTKIKYSLENIKITCALKNIFGCNPYPKKFKYHPKLDEAIVALNKAMKFNLHLVDGNIVSGMQPRKLGLIMASTDPVALDTAAARIAGVNPDKIRYLQLARNEGLGHTTYTVKGMSPNYFRDRYPKKDIKKKLMAKAFDLATRLKLTNKLGIE